MEPHIITERIYISGPMSGLTREEYTRRFNYVEGKLRELGYRDIINPTRLFISKPWVYRIMGYRLTLLYDLWLLMHCQRIYKMPGWKQSRGANIESCVAFHFSVSVVQKPTREQLDKDFNDFIHSETE